MAAYLSAAFMLIGAAFMLIAALGVVRFPDLFMRLHANTKSATLGVGCLMVAAALQFESPAITTRALAVIVFLFLTAPVGAHVLGRAAYISRIPLWDGTLSDDLRGHYDASTHALAGPEAPRVPLPEEVDEEQGA
jgi:multicomponent Na+:H+ antiporter subunit G